MNRVLSKNINYLDLNDLLVSMIGILICIASCLDCFYTRDFSNYTFNKLYRYSVYVIVLVCIVKLVIDFFVTNGKVYPVIACMLFVFVYVSFISWVFDLLSFRYLIVDNLAWILVFCVFYMYGYRQQFNDRGLQRVLIFGTICFYITCTPNLLRHISNTDGRGGAISSLYFGLSFLEAILTVCTRKVRALFVLITGMMILFSTKRAGFVVFALGMLFYLFIDAVIEEKADERFQKYCRILLILTFAVIIGLAAIEIFNIGILDRFASISEDGGSGRDGIWEMILDRYRASNQIHKIFGYGFHAVPELVHPDGRYIFAHNGFIEVLFDFGMVGLTGMIAGIAWLFYLTVCMIRERMHEAGIMGFILVHIMMFTMTSYLFEESRVILPMCIACGICIGHYHRKISGIGL